MSTYPSLVLTSSFQTVANELREKNLVPPPGASVAFIPTAANPYPVHPWIDADREALADLGYRVTDVDIENRTGVDLRAELSKHDVIFVAGGLVTYLAEHARRSGFNAIIRGLLRDGKIYVGSSAGSMIVGPTVEPFLEEEKTELPTGFVLENPECMRLVDFAILPHDQVSEFAKQHDAIEKRYAGTYRFVRLTDSEYRCETV